MAEAVTCWLPLGVPEFVCEPEGVESWLPVKDRVCDCVALDEGVADREGVTVRVRVCVCVFDAVGEGVADCVRLAETVCERLRVADVVEVLDGVSVPVML